MGKAELGSSDQLAVVEHLHVARARETPGYAWQPALVRGRVERRGHREHDLFGVFDFGLELTSTLGR